jgi:CDP-diacylglycerol pyrophosphatase
VISNRTVGIPFPCLAVNAPPVDRGYTVLRPPGSITEVLVVPTAPIPGIESPILLEPDAPDYFQAAWNARRYVIQALGEDPGWNEIGMAVNSKPGRSQDRLHIHVDCIRPYVATQLARLKRGLGPKWAQLPIALHGNSYWGRTIAAAEFDTINPFASMAAGVPNARRSMRDMTLAVLGAKFDDGTNGFYLLASRAGTRRGTAAAEDLLDHSCRIKSS